MVRAREDVNHSQAYGWSELASLDERFSNTNKYLLNILNHMQSSRDVEVPFGLWINLRKSLQC